MTLADLAEALRRFRLLAIGLLIVIFLAGVAAALLPAERFRTTAVVAVEPISQSVGFESQQAIQLTIPPTIARLVSPTFEQSVRARIAQRHRDEPIDISAVHDPGTAIIDIAVQSATEAAAVEAAAVALQRLVQEPRSDRFRVNIVSPPGAASSVRAQRLPPLVLGSLVLGVIIAVLTAVAMHRLLPQVPRAEQFRRRFGHDVLGEIPDVGRRERRASHGMLAGSVSAEMQEAFRSLEARMSRRAGERDPREGMSVVVTSWGKEEGKSTVVANLACALAGSGSDVTVVDCDMRRPRLHALLGSEIEPGVAEIADGKAVGGVVQSTKLPSLEVIAAGLGRLSRHPAETAQEAVPVVLSALRERIVLVDAPPLFTAETGTIVGEADFVVLVADHRRRRAEDVDAAIAELELFGTPLLGVVLNRVDMTDGRGRESYVYQPGARHRKARRRLRRRRRA